MVEYRHIKNKKVYNVIHDKVINATNEEKICIDGWPKEVFECAKKLGERFQFLHSDGKWSETKSRISTETSTIVARLR